MAIIQVENLTKSYKGRQALAGISFEIESGAIFGFVGPNGAGKTTTIRILTTLLNPSGGTALVDGLDVRTNRQAVRAKLGYVPDYFGVYHEMTGEEYLDFFAACYNVPSPDRPRLIDDLLTLVDLQHRRQDQVESLSRGMRQRLGLARALIHDPKILILDEPAAGLDPRARVEFRALLAELQQMGKTIFFSSHILADVDELCTEVGIIEAGKMVAVGNLEALRDRMQGTHLITLRVMPQHVEQARLVLSQIPGVAGLQEKQTEADEWRLRFDFAGDKAAVGEIVSKMVKNDVAVLSLQDEEHSLEQMFMTLTEGIVS